MHHWQVPRSAELAPQKSLAHLSCLTLQKCSARVLRLPPFIFDKWFAVSIHPSNQPHGAPEATTGSMRSAGRAARPGSKAPTIKCPRNIRSQISRVNNAEPCGKCSVCYVQVQTPNAASGLQKAPFVQRQQKNSCSTTYEVNPQAGRSLCSVQAGRHNVLFAGPRCRPTSSYYSMRWRSARCPCCTCVSHTRWCASF